MRKHVEEKMRRGGKEGTKGKEEGKGIEGKTRVEGSGEWKRNGRKQKGPG